MSDIVGSASDALPKRSRKPKIHVSCDPVIHQIEERIQLEQESPPSLTWRQSAEMQLSRILNDPELSSSHFVKNETKWELKNLATCLQTQPWLIKDILHPLNVPNTEVIGVRDINLFTRVLTASFDVCLLLFFNLIDIDRDQKVNKEEFMLFFNKYLDGLSVFHESDATVEVRRKAILTPLLAKFQLHEYSQIDFDQFYELVRNDELLTEILPQFTVHPSWLDKLDKDQTRENQEMKYQKKENDRSWWPPKALLLRVLKNNARMHQKLHDGLEDKLSRVYFSNNLSRIVFLLIYLSVSIGLIIFVIIYRVDQRLHWLEIVARICGMQLNFNCMMMILLMLRYTMGLIRSNRILYSIFPVDDAISIHKMIGRWIVVLVIIHSFCHMLYFGMGETEYSWVDCMFTTRAKIGMIGITPLLGIILSVVLCIMVIGSLKSVRHGHFEVFYLTHLLYIVFYILLILHARNFGYWLIGPGIIFILEKIYYLYKRYSTAKGSTKLHSVDIEQENVVKLTIDRPSDFKFRPGDYVRLNIPQVARWEWHPFTLTSAPEDLQWLTVHIKSEGNWTTKVLDRYKQLAEPNVPGSVLEDAPSKRILIDGPYATCARYVFNCSHAILIGTGIGITPYASILASLLDQYRNHNDSEASLGTHKRLVKIDFVWICRSMKNFEWFLKLLKNLENEQESRERTTMRNPIDGSHRFLNIHLYLTGIKQDSNIGSVPLSLVTRVYEQAHHEDIFTRLKTKTHMGKPNWDQLFNTILTNGSQSNIRDVAAFFCGRKDIAEIVEIACIKHKIEFKKEHF